MAQQDVSVVMGEALFHLERITEHVRYYPDLSTLPWWLTMG